MCWYADEQACHAAYDVIDETAVYNCTGNPHPKDIERVVQSMMSDEFGTSYSCTSVPLPSFYLPFNPLSRSVSFCAYWTRKLTIPVITSLKIERGLALQDMISGAYEFLQTVDIPAQSRIYLLDHLGQCE